MKFCDPSFFSISKDRLFCSSFQQLPLFMATEDENSIQERYGEYRNSKTALVLGVRMPPFYVKGFKDFIENFQTRHDDVFIVGFPRSGELIILSKSETKTKFPKIFCYEDQAHKHPTLFGEMITRFLTQLLSDDFKFPTRGQSIE